jgi:D-beta-D-heptose 7-phosphate kinase/D-beta-D-heptose 1-phosphate adenosyltransferase
MTRSPKIKTVAELAALRGEFRRNETRVVFTNGCFDLLHAGHVHCLEAARREGDLLVVGLNSDRSVQSIKGDRLPIIGEDERAEVLAGLACVDFITVFAEPDPLRVIQALEPDVLVKGDDWPEKVIVGGDLVRRKGGRVVRIPVVEGLSTSGIIARILDRWGATAATTTVSRREAPPSGDRP